jgi:hypothetical protein
MTRFASSGSLIAAIAAALFALSASVAVAEGDKSDRTEKAPAKTKVIDDDALLTMLRDMGYDPKVDKTADGAAIYTLIVKQDTWTKVVEVSLSPNKRKVWLSAPLPSIPAEKVTGGPLLALLQENWDLAPAHFRVYKPGKPGNMLSLGLAVDNRDITPQVLRQELDFMLGAISRTHPLWDVAKWPSAGPDLDRPKAGPPPREEKDKEPSKEKDKDPSKDNEPTKD